MPSLCQVFLFAIAHLTILSSSKPLGNDTVQPPFTPACEPTAETKVTTAFQGGLDQVPLAQTFAREFIGWHGTNSHSAQHWQTVHHIEMPPPPTVGCLDFIGFIKRVFKCGTFGQPGTTGANHELGPGFYITDDIYTAIVFANNNQKVNPSTTAMVCAIFATSGQDWTAVPKAFLRNSLVTDDENDVMSRQLEAARLAHIRTVLPNAEARNVVKFSNLDRYGTPPLTAQMCVPDSLTASIEVGECYPVSALDPKNPPTGTPAFPTFSYGAAALRTAWHVVGVPDAPEPEPGTPQSV